MNLEFFLAEKILAQKMVDELVKQLPAKTLTQQTKVLSVNRITKILEKVYQTASTKRDGRKLGFVKKAVLANNFKWGLKSSGYSQEFIDMATEGLIVEISKNSH